MNLDRSVQALADRIGCPIMVFDSAFRVVAFSIHEGEVDRARLSMILSHKSSARAAKMITDHGVDRAPGAVLLPAVAGAPPRVVAALRYDDRLTGYVSYVPHPDDDADQRDAPEIVAARAELGALLAAREAEQRHDADRVLRLTSQLLDGHESQRKQAADELLDANLVSAAPDYTVLVLRAAAESHHVAAQTRLMVERGVADFTTMMSRRVVGTVIDGEGILIVPAALGSDRLLRLLAGKAFSSLRGGAGTPRADLVDARDSRREARIALRATTHDADRYGRLASWDDLGLDRVLLQLPLERLGVHDLPAGVARLLADSTGPDLAKTLEVYLDNGTNAQLTAQRLHLHRSTLYYRLDRIRSLIDADLADGTVRRELHTALRVATLAGLR